MRSPWFPALAVAGSLALAPAAQAGTLGFDGVHFTYTAAPGESNGVTIPNASLLRDAAPITVAPSAQAVCQVMSDPGLARCDFAAPWIVDLGDGDDGIRGS